MKAIILSAGQGRRLGELTRNSPKCLLDLAGRPLIEWQLAALEQGGVERVVVVAGFGAEQVAAALARPGLPGLETRILLNPDYATADNLISCWMARAEMDGEFLLVNGDSLFESGVVVKLVADAVRPVSLAVATKPVYDADDMKVSCAKGTVRRVAKDIPAAEVTGEAIGVSFFRGAGPRLMRETLETFASRPEGRRLWYLSATNHLAQQGYVGAVSIDGCAWAEVDFPADVEVAEHIIRGRIEPDLAAGPGPDSRRACG